MFQKVILFTLLTLFTFTLNAQEALTEKQKSVIATFEGFPPLPFEAPDLNEKMHFLPEYKDNVVLLHFWNTTDEASIAAITELNKLKEAYAGKELVIISFADDKREVLEPFMTTNKVDYPIIPNSKELGNMAYGGSLGNPRTFVIDKFGVIKRVVLGSDDLMNRLKVIVDENM